MQPHHCMPGFGRQHIRTKQQQCRKVQLDNRTTQSSKIGQHNPRIGHHKSSTRPDTTAANMQRKRKPEHGPTKKTKNGLVYPATHPKRTQHHPVCMVLNKREARAPIRELECCADRNITRSSVIFTQDFGRLRLTKYQTFLQIMEICSILAGMLVKA